MPYQQCSWCTACWARLGFRSTYQPGSLRIRYQTAARTSPIRTHCISSTQLPHCTSLRCTARKQLPCWHCCTIRQDTARNLQSWLHLSCWRRCQLRTRSSSTVLNKNMSHLRRSRMPWTAETLQTCLGCTLCTRSPQTHWKTCPPRTGCRCWMPGTLQRTQHRTFCILSPGHPGTCPRRTGCTRCHPCWKSNPAPKHQL